MITKNINNYFADFSINPSSILWTGRISWDLHAHTVYPSM